MPAWTASERRSDAANARIAAVIERVVERLREPGGSVPGELADSIPELRGDAVIQELLRASTTSNVETYFDVVRYGIDVAEVQPPSAAVEYARRLAQRGTSTNALLRAYRMGQSRVLGWVLAEIAATETRHDVAFEVTRIFQELSFAYVDHVAEQVVAEYEQERERWLAHRNTMRATTVASLLADEPLDLAAAEAALGHRLRQQHLAVVVWSEDLGTSHSDLPVLERLVSDAGRAAGTETPHLFLPQDGGLAWAWLPLGRRPETDVDTGALGDLVAAAGPRYRIALGSAAPGDSGFRASHREALRAHRVASVAGAHAQPVTSFADRGVRIAALLADDLDETRRLVGASLGGLAGHGESAHRLRETLREFLAHGSSYLATANAVHLHKNTVKYRVDKALDARGRGIEEDRLDLEVALTAVRWLGPRALPAS